MAVYSSLLAIFSTGSVDRDPPVPHRKMGRLAHPRIEFTMRRPQRLTRRISQLVIGLALYGLGIALIVQGGLGSAPWDVLTQGISTRIPLSFGTITILVSVAVMLLWIPLKQRPGIGTVTNALAVGPFADAAFLVLPDPAHLAVRICFTALGIVTIGAATGLYIGAKFGPGPRDGLMTGLHQLTGRPIWIVRTSLEITVVIVGWLLGGVVGFGTLAFALCVGPLCQFFLRLFEVGIEPGAE